MSAYDGHVGLLDLVIFICHQCSCNYGDFDLIIIHSYLKVTKNQVRNALSVSLQVSLFFLFISMCVFCLFLIVRFIYHNHAYIYKRRQQKGFNNYKTLARIKNAFCVYYWEGTS